MKYLTDKNSDSMCSRMSEIATEIVGIEDGSFDRIDVSIRKIKRPGGMHFYRTVAKVTITQIAMVDSPLMNSDDSIVKEDSSRM